MNDAEFYQEFIDPGFRFGDVIKGFISATPNVSNPPINSDNTDYSIEISMPYCAIISPCCSIKDKVISLSPLLHINKVIFMNPYFREDLTRINRTVVQPEKSIPPEVFEKMPPEKKIEILSKVNPYAFLNLFVYKEHDFFPEYPIRLKGADDFNTRYYMIDFRNTFRVNCSKIQNATNVPPGLKCLQLTIDTRNVLRDKITKYYGRLPAEDFVD